ncbi:AraC family transcriptional regulator [uncultured Kordia sp.]|uniref:AraC family transcriptional regulator n=1 Tax=uncultured Kordia sp. TaxID=507699 RepID=UPI002629E3BD|nr:AraC family transcriptional regulator [uncultured Kordia sp.]
MLAYQRYSNSYFLKILFILWLGLSCSVSNAQTDSLAYKTYEELATLYIIAIKKDAKRAFHYATAAHELATKKNNQKEIAESLYFIAKSNNDLSNNTLALEQLQEVLSIGKQLKDSVLLFRGNSLKGNVYNNIGEESKALEAYLEAKKYSAFSEKERDLILLEINIAFIKKLHRDYEDAIVILKENLKRLEKVTFDAAAKDRYELITLMNLADTYLRMKENGGSQFVKEAEYYNNKGLKRCSTKKNTVFYYVFVMNKAIIQYENGVYDESIKFTKEVADYAIQNNNESLTCTTYFYLGKNYHKLKNYKESIRFLEKAYDIIKKSERKYSNEKELHELLTYNFGQTEALDKMKFHFAEFTKLEKEQSQQDVKIINDIHTKNDVPTLKEQVDELDTRLAHQKRRKSILYIISAGLGLILLVSIIFYRRKVKKIKEKVAQVLEKVNDLEKVKTQNKTKIVTTTEKIPDKKALEILTKLKAFEENEEFMVQGCTLIYVAEQLKSNTTYLSKVINTYKGKTFNSYLNELRINKALIQLKNDAKLRSYTIKGIAEEFGFKRQETFSRAFKQQTGIYPSQYLKKLSQTTKDD